jgi:hypothetical protein
MTVPQFYGPHTLCEDGRICTLPQCAVHGCMMGAVCEKCGEPIDLIDGCRCAWETDEHD